MTRVKTITVKKNSKTLKKCQKIIKKRRRFDVYSRRHFQAKMNKEKLFEYKYTRNKSLESKIKHY